MNLETLYIEVKLQTDEIKKGVESAQKQIEKLTGDFEKLGKTSDKTVESFRNLGNSLTRMFAGYVGFNTLLSGASGAIAAIRDVGKASRELNVDVTALDAWGHAVQRTGGSAQQFQSSLQSLANHFGTTGEVALRVLPRLADLFARLNPRQAQQYGKSLGLDLNTILLLQQGRREVEAVVAQQQRLGLVTKEQIDITRKFDNAIYDAGRAYQTFYRELALPLLPGITQGLNYLTEHKDVVADAFKVMAVGVGALSIALIRLSGPIGIAAAGLTALAAGYGIIKEDIKFFREGKDSALGHALGYVPGPIKNTNQIGKNAVAQGVGGFLLSIPSQIFSNLRGHINYQGPFTVGGSGKTEVNIENININTAAVDAEGIAAAAKGSIQQHLSQLVSHVDDGVQS